MKRGWYVSSATSERRFDTRREAESAMRAGDFLHRECECGCGKSASYAVSKHYGDKVRPYRVSP